jgi:hypothetical protein
LLIYMATIAEAVRQLTLELYSLPDWERRLPIRPLWISPEFWDWADGKAELETKEGGKTLFEHMEQMFREFRCSERFGAGDLKRMIPNPSGVRTMRPPKLRVYGWCPAQHQFVVVCGALESETKADKGLNDRKRDEVLDFIRRNNLGAHVLLGDASAVFPPKT